MASSPNPASHVSSSSSSLPVIAIVGTTGVGKSKLGIEIAKHLARRSSQELSSESSSSPAASPDAGSSSSSSSRWMAGEVVNADSMQIFRGLDVITNKVTEQEAEGVPHRLIGVVDPRGEKGWGMKRWVEVTLAEIEELHGQGAVPLVTGGTTYWVQHLLFPLGKPVEATALSAPAVSDERVPFLPSPSPDLPAFLDALPEPLTAAERALLYSLPALPLKPPDDQSLAIWQLLDKVDPLLAAKWHWRDTRKVLRGLERVWNEAQRESALWEEQARKRAETQGQSDGDKRYKTLIFWLYAQPQALNPRLDERVDKMVDLGLLDELREMREISDAYRASFPDAAEEDLASGIFQSIGYKEFAPLPTAQLKPDAKDLPAFKQALDRMKIATRQYAKSQVKWIAGKLRDAVDERVTSDGEGLFLLNATDLSHWDDNVLQPALSVVDAFLAEQALPSREAVGGPLALALLPPAAATVVKSTLPTTSRQRCELCSTDTEPCFIMFDGEDAASAIKAHERGKRHRGRVRELHQAEMEPIYAARRLEAQRRKANAAFADRAVPDP